MNTNKGIEEIGRIALSLEHKVRTTVGKLRSYESDWSELWGETLQSFIQECNKKGYNKFDSEKKIFDELTRQCRYNFKIDGLLGHVSYHISQAAFKIAKIQKKEGEISEDEAVKRVKRNENDVRYAWKIVNNGYFTKAKHELFDQQEANDE